MSGYHSYCAVTIVTALLPSYCGLNTVTMGYVYNTYFGYRVRLSKVTMVICGVTEIVNFMLLETVSSCIAK